MGSSFEKAIKKVGRQIDKYITQPILDVADQIIEEIGEFIFGNPTIYTVQVQYSPMLSDPPDTFKETVLSSVINKTNVMKAVAQNNIYSYYNNTRNSYNYAKDYYVDGLPNGTLQGLEPNRLELQTVLDNLEGTSTTIELAMVDYADPNYYVLKYLEENTDYDRATGILATHDVTKADGSPITETLYLHSAVMLKDQVNQLRVLYFYYTDVENNLAEAVYKDYLIPTVDYGALYYQCIYHSPIIPPSEINPNFTPEQILAKKNEFYDLYTTIATTTEIVNGEEVTTTTTTTDVDAADTDLINWAQSNFITALQLGYAIGWTEQEVINRAAELMLPDYTPPVQTVDSKYFFYNIDTNVYPQLFTEGTATYLSPFLPVYSIKDNKVNLTSNPTSQRYITTKRGLNKLNITMDTILEAVDDTTNNPDANLVTDVFVMNAVDLRSQDPSVIRYLYGFFSDMSLLSNVNKAQWFDWLNNETNKVSNTAPYNLIDINEANYNIKLVWNYISISPPITGTLGIVDTVTSSLVYVEPYKYGGEVGADGEANPVLYAPRSKLVLRRQITTNQYIEMEINGILTNTDVRTRGMFRQVIAPVVSETQMYLPVAFTVLKSMNPRDRLQVSYLSLVSSIYAINEQELEWYETAAFLNFIEVGLIVLSVYLFIPTLGASTTWKAAAIAALEYIAYSYVIGIAFEELVELVGPEAALVLAIIGAGLGLYGGDLSQYAKLLPDAKELFALSTQLMSKVSEVTYRESSKLREQSEDLLETYKDKMERIEKILDELSTDGNLNYYDIIKGESPIDTSETPEQFYNRTVGTALDMAEVSLKLPDMYAELMLELPKVLPAYTNSDTQIK